MEGIEFLISTSEMEAFFIQLRKQVYERMLGNIGNEECLSYQASALLLIAIDDFRAEVLLQTDNVLDALPVENGRLVSLAECCENSFLMIDRLDEIWEHYDESDEEDFLRLTEIEIELLENLALIPGWPDIEILHEKSQIGRRLLEKIREGNQYDEEAYDDFREFVAHIGTLLVGMTHSDSASAYT